ncbi:uncharacterized protein [Pseudorca crassidens]|uniref:uncharacterized protein n=1 Tax=Pseudorca crassidens TaxID=82174 RepID=UPI00352DEAD8
MGKRAGGGAWPEARGHRAGSLRGGRTQRSEGPGAARGPWPGPVARAPRGSGLGSPRCPGTGRGVWETGRQGRRSERGCARRARGALGPGMSGFGKLPLPAWRAPRHTPSPGGRLEAGGDVRRRSLREGTCLGPTWTAGGPGEMEASLLAGARDREKEHLSQGVQGRRGPHPGGKCEESRGDRPLRRPGWAGRPSGYPDEPPADSAYCELRFFSMHRYWTTQMLQNVVL